jgi:GNAT superfamily N-acetyltransferase
LDAEQLRLRRLPAHCKDLIDDHYFSSPNSRPIAAAQELIREYTTWAYATFAESSQAPTFKGLEEELATLPGIYTPPAGRLLLARHGEEAAGCVCLKGHNATTSKLKRLYVRPKFRGLNIGWQLVNRLVEEARQAEYHRIVLDSHRLMTKAHALYQAVGSKRVAPPDDFPEAFKPIVVFMECDLPAS